MKIIQILPELNSGGVERGTLEVGHYLAQHGHESIVISNGGRLVEQLEAEGSRHIALPVHKKRLSSLKQVKILRALLEHEKPDILHLRSRVPAWLAWLAWRKMDPTTRPKLVSTVHGFYSVNAYSKIMTRGQSVICVSRSVKDYVRTHYPDVSPDKLYIIHRGVSTHTHPYGFQPSLDWQRDWQAQYPQLQGKYIISLPGRITRWKGALDFIEIIRALKTKGLPVHGLLIGEPHPRKLDYFEEVKDHIRSAQLENDITLTGHRSDVREIIASSNVVISLSTDPEAFGRVTLEALSMGKPVAGYDHGGVHEQLSALLPEGKIPVGDLNAMTNLLSIWHDNPAYPNKDNPFTLDTMLAQTHSIYQQLHSTP